MNNTKNKKTNKKSNKNTAKKEDVEVKKTKKTSTKNKKETQENTTKLNFKDLFKNKSFIAILILLTAFGLGMLLRGIIVAATVNGRPITRLKVIRQLEETQGEATLESLVNETLIQQELEKNDIAVSPAEVEAELANIRQELSASGQDLDQLLEMQGLTMERIKKDIEIQLGLEKILEDKINVTEEEINSYIEQNEEAFGEETDITSDEFKQQIAESLRQQKLSTEFTKWLEDLKSKSNIEYYVDY